MPLEIQRSLDDQRAACLAAVESAAQSARVRHITPGADDEHALKNAEAAAIRAGSESPTPIIDAEADATGQSRQQRADVVYAAACRCDDATRQIAHIRGPARATINAATTAAEMAQARIAACAALGEI